MDDFDIPISKGNDILEIGNPIIEEKEENSSEMDMISINVSPICQGKNGERYAFVLFSDGKRSAEGKIPDCKIIHSGEFSEEEVLGLEQYMNNHVMKLKSMAASVDVMGAFLNH